MTSSPKCFYARPSSYTRISTFLILYFLIGFTGFIFGFVAISGQSLGYKCRSGKSRLVSVVWDRNGSGIGNGAEVPDGDQKGTRLWVSLEFKLGLHQWYGGDPCGRLGCHLISKDFNEFNVAWDIVIELTQFFPLLSFRSSLKAVGVAHNALVGSVVIWLMIKDALKSPGAVKCSQCEHTYHEACLKEHTCQEVASNTWFCGESCQEVYSGLQSRIRIVNLLTNGCLGLF